MGNNRRSVGTTLGMRRWYATKPRCKHCPKGLKPRILFKGITPDIKMCSRCFVALTGESLASQWEMFALETTIEKRNYGNYVSWLKQKIKHTIQKTK